LNDLNNQILTKHDEKIENKIKLKFLYTKNINFMKNRSSFYFHSWIIICEETDELFNVMCFSKFLTNFNKIQKNSIIRFFSNYKKFDDMGWKIEWPVSLFFSKLLVQLSLPTYLLICNKTTKTFLIGNIVAKIFQWRTSETFTEFRLTSLNKLMTENEYRTVVFKILFHLELFLWSPINNVKKKSSNLTTYAETKNHYRILEEYLNSLISGFSIFGNQIRISHFYTINSFMDTLKKSFGKINFLKSWLQNSIETIGFFSPKQPNKRKTAALVFT
jgi:hypothetical protein